MRKYMHLLITEYNKNWRCARNERDRDDIQTKIISNEAILDYKTLLLKIPYAHKFKSIATFATTEEDLNHIDNLSQLRQRLG